MSDPGPARHASAVVACARWEEDGVREWVAYHRSIGVGHIFLYSNDDDPSAMRRLLTPHLFGPAPFVTLRHLPVAGGQAETRRHFLAAFKDRTEWFAFLDADEFLVVKDGDDVNRLIRRFDDQADCIVLHRVEYGAGGRTRRDDSPVLTSRLRRAASPDPHTKLLCRSDAVGADGGLARARCVDVMGEPASRHAGEDFAGAEAMLARPGAADAIIGAAYVAHFRFKAENDFQRRWERDGSPDSARLKAMRDSGEHRDLLARGEAVYDTYLAEYWHRFTAPALDVMLRVPPEHPPAPNVALHKPSWQSSVYVPDSPEPAGARVAGAANDGVRSGSYGFHTAREDDPWWAVDLLGAFRLLGVRVFNRVDNPSVVARSKDLDVLVSMDGVSWTVVWSRAEPGPFGGAGGAAGGPLEAMFRDPPLARMLALRLRGPGFLHLDEVEAFGLPG